MKIGIEAQRIFRKKKHGMEVVTIELIKHLQLIDKKNEYIIFIKDGEDSNCIAETENFKIKTINSFSFPDWEQVQLPKAARAERLDILHCTSNTAPVYLDIPLIVTIHDLIYLEKLDFGGTAYQNFGNLYRRLVVPVIAKKAKKIVTVSDFERDNIISTLKVSESKITTVYNAKANDFKKTIDQTECRKTIEKYRLPAEYLLFFGNAAPRKNTVGVLRAYSQYVENGDSLPLVITSLETQEVESLARKNSIDFTKFKDKVICTGYIDKEDLPNLYSLATIYLYPSFREGFGLPIIESMACGTPVITANISSMPEVAGDAALLVDPHDASELANAISDLTSNPELRNKLIGKGLQRSKQFEWTNTARQILGLYDSMQLD